MLTAIATLSDSTCVGIDAFMSDLSIIFLSIPLPSLPAMSIYFVALVSPIFLSPFATRDMVVNFSLFAISKILSLLALYIGILRVYPLRPVSKSRIQGGTQWTSIERRHSISP